MSLKFSFAILMLALLPAFAVATTCTVTSVSTPPGATAGGEAVDASASFCASAGQVVITLTNLQTGIVDAGQLLTDLQFSMNTSDTLTSSALTSSSADFITIASGGGVTDNGTSSTGWGFGSGTLGTGNFLLCLICGDGVTATSQPSEGIIGPGPYTSANGSIAGNPSHNPFINQVGTFTITDSHITSSTNFSGVVFSFGTTFGNNAVPEPRTYVPLLLAFGLIALAVHRRRAGSARA